MEMTSLFLLALVSLSAHMDIVDGCSLAEEQHCQEIDCACLREENKDIPQDMTCDSVHATYFESRCLDLWSECTAECTSPTTGCTQADQDECNEQDCACLRGKNSDIPADKNCKSVHRNYFDWDCNDEWMECMQEKKCQLLQ